MKVFTGDNPTQLYLEGLKTLLQEGDDVCPRGKSIKEVRPAAFEFTNPRNRVTFVKGRKINPFFQLAEALWILSGRSDVEWLTKYNSNMKQFSDDGIYFNGAYGERLRTWNQSRYNDFIFNPVDQLKDVYLKIRNDKDTRQAVALIYNPMFDNINYSGNGGKDTPCNIALTFKVRNEKLYLTVYNRSNDLHWGVFGANLVQFSTIQEVMASWLGVDVGTYTQITDSLHIYTEDYGFRCTADILDNYKNIDDVDTEYTKCLYNIQDEPRITSSFEDFDEDLMYYWTVVDGLLHNDTLMINPEYREGVFSAINNIRDDYLRLTVQAMYSYRCYKLEQYLAMLDMLSYMKKGQWKISCSSFVKNKVYKEGYGEHFERLVLGTLPECSRDYVKSI